MERWQNLVAPTNAIAEKRTHLDEFIPHEIDWQDDLIDEPEFKLQVVWMACPNDQCAQPIVGVETFVSGLLISPDEGDEQLDAHDFQRWIAYPRLSATRPIDASVPAEFADSYLEASAILELSPSASAALARRVLADLLRKYGYDDFLLSKQIEDFAQDSHHPSALRENVRYLAQIGNFATHTQKDQSTGEIVGVTQEEAEWSLDVLDGLFEYLIVAPRHDEERRRAMDAKLDRTGRSSIRRADKNPKD